MDLVLLAIALLIILLGAELFTNGIEWFGHKLGLAEGAVGAVLAAVGPALPETMIPLIAILLGGGSSDEVGIGAILGAPFMLATLAMFVTGAAVLWRRNVRATGETLNVSGPVLVHDMRFFAIAYALAVGVAFVPADLAWPRWLMAAVLLSIYAYYVREHFQAEAGGGDPDLAPLRLHRLDVGGPAQPDPPRLRVVGFQVVLALACIIGGAYLFVGAVTDLAHSLGADEALLALIIAPIATELPEKFNSVIWVRQGHPGDGQHHRRDGLPERDPDLGRARVRLVRLGHLVRIDPRLRVGRDRLRVVGGDLHPARAGPQPDRPPAAERRGLLPGLPRAGRRPAGGGLLSTEGARGAPGVAAGAAGILGRRSNGPRPRPSCCDRSGAG